MLIGWDLELEKVSRFAPISFPRGLDACTPDRSEGLSSRQRLAGASDCPLHWGGSKQVVADGRLQERVLASSIRGAKKSDDRRRPQPGFCLGWPQQARTHARTHSPSHHLTLRRLIIDQLSKQTNRPWRAADGLAAGGASTAAGSSHHPSWYVNPFASPRLLAPWSGSNSMGVLCQLYGYCFERAARFAQSRRAAGRDRVHALRYSTNPPTHCAQPLSVCRLRTATTSTEAGSTSRTRTWARATQTSRNSESGWAVVGLGV